MCDGEPTSDRNCWNAVGQHEEICRSSGHGTTERQSGFFLRKDVKHHEPAGIEGKQPTHEFGLQMFSDYFQWLSSKIMRSTTVGEREMEKSSWTELSTSLRLDRVVDPFYPHIFLQGNKPEPCRTSVSPKGQ